MLIARPRRAHSAMTNRGFVRDYLRSGRGCRSATAGPASRVAERSPHALAVFFLRPCPADLGSGAAERKFACLTAEVAFAGMLRHELGHACCLARAVAPVNPTLVLLISHARRRHGTREDASSSRGDSSSEASNIEGAVLASACKTLAKSPWARVQRGSAHECSGHELT